MKPSLFDVVGDGFREFFAILLGHRRCTWDDIDEVFDLPQVQFKSRCLEDSCTAAVRNDNPGSDSHGEPLSVIGRLLGGHRKSSCDASELAGQRQSISNAHR
ncbi:MAG: hypothetical protein WCA85_22090 [Paraburkholderia sp.]|uniref:hypothetical protein n=1 Tax=Paraburkholderia sp. TaxID=1926495 RepID=UPI003C447FC0